MRALEHRFRSACGHTLPISAFGQTKAMTDSAEGRCLMQDLRQAGIPFIGLHGVVPGAPTGSHVHIGPDSPRLFAW